MGFSLHEISTIFVSDDVEPSLEAPRLVKADVGMSLHSRGMETKGMAAGGRVLLRREEASTSRTATTTSLPLSIGAKVLLKRVMSLVLMLTWTT